MFEAVVVVLEVGKHLTPPALEVRLEWVLTTTQGGKLGKGGERFRGRGEYKDVELFCQP